MIVPAPMLARSPMTAPAPTTTVAATAAVGAIFAVGSTTADGCTPGGTDARGCSSAATLAKIAYGLASTSAGNDVSPAISGATITADARVDASNGRYFGLARKA